jgi:N-acetylmuramoyl-L-alanine amidase
MVKNLQYSILLLALTASLSAFKWMPAIAAAGIKVIVIDPGHGGKDPGCQGVTHKEKDIALAVALKLGKYIEENMKDVNVIYTRTTDVFIDLEERAQIANKAKADLFISIHCNAAGKPVMVTDAKTGKQRPKMYKNRKGKLVVVETSNPVPFGSETYVMGLKNEEGKMKVATRENSAIFYEDDYEKKYGGFDPESEESYIIMSNYTSAYVIQSANLALKIQEEYAGKAGRVNKGVHRQSIWVLWRTSMPSILTELGYLTNPLEEKFMSSEQGQDYLAKALFRGVRRYKDEAEGRKKEYNDEFTNQAPLENENLKAREEELKKTEQEKRDSLQKKKDTVALRVADNDELQKKNLKQTERTHEPVTDGRSVEILSPVPDSSEDVKSMVSKYKRKDSLDGPSGGAAVVVAKEEIIFKVQFASSDVELNLKQGKFSSIVDGDFYRAGNLLKYTSGRFKRITDAQAHQALLKQKGFTDCFIIATKNNQRIDMAEARKLSGQ